MKKLNAGNSNEFPKQEERMIVPNVILNRLFSVILAMTVMFTVMNCSDDDDATSENSYLQTNLVSDVSGYGAARVDAKLTNPWGIAIGPTGSLWMAANHSGYTVIYDRNGIEKLPAIPIAGGGSPTGVVYNDDPANFLGAKYIYAGEDGTISIWTSGVVTTVAADRSAQGAVYKGLAIASDNDVEFLYLANFKGNNIDVFDANFNFVTSKPFDDPTIPAGFAPFNIYEEDGKLFVTYAKLKGPDNEDDEAGAGNGYVNIFNPDGSMVKRFASQGTLNSPWAVIDAPEGFGLGEERILIGNFGDGRINVYDEDGNYKGQLKNNGNVISIEGLWALEFPEDGIPAGDQNQLFFTAGPGDETHGVFGYLSLK